MTTKLPTAPLHRLRPCPRLGHLVQVALWLTTLCVTPLVQAAPPDPAPALPSLTKLAPRPLVGPFASVAAFCATQPKQNRRGDPLTCGQGKPAVKGPIQAAIAAPYREIRLIAVNDGIDCSVGLRTSAGWFFTEHAMGCDWPGKKSLTIDELRSREGLVHLRWTRRSSFAVSDRAGGTQSVDREEAMLILCGVGPAGKPSCTPMIPVSHVEQVGARRTAGALEVSVSAGPVLNLKGDPAVLVGSVVHDRWAVEAIGQDTGAHRIIFP